MYNASDMDLNAYININVKVDNKWKVKSNFITLCFAFKGYILNIILNKPLLIIYIDTMKTLVLVRITTPSNH